MSAEAECVELRARVDKLERELKHARYFEIHDDAIDIFTKNLRDRTEGTPLEALACDCATNIEQLRKQRNEAERKLVQTEAVLDAARSDLTDLTRPNPDVRIRDQANVIAGLRDERDAAWRDITNLKDKLKLVGKRASNLHSGIIELRGRVVAWSKPPHEMRQYLIDYINGVIGRGPAGVVGDGTSPTGTTGK